MEKRDRLYIDSENLKQLVQNGQIDLQGFENSVAYLMSITNGIVIRGYGVPMCSFESFVHLNPKLKTYQIPSEPIFICERRALLANKSLEYRNFGMKYPEMGADVDYDFRE